MTHPYHLRSWTTAELRNLTNDQLRAALRHFYEMTDQETLQTAEDFSAIVDEQTNRIRAGTWTAERFPRARECERAADSHPRLVFDDEEETP